MHNFAVGLRKRSVYSWILQRELNSACHSGLSLFLWDASSLVLICSVGTPRSHFFSFFFFFFSLLQDLHEFVFGIQRMLEFHPFLRLRQAKCLPAACYYNLRDMVRISICICLEFRFFVRKKTLWVFAEVARLFFLGVCYIILYWNKTSCTRIFLFQSWHNRL